MSHRISIMTSNVLVPLQNTELIQENMLQMFIFYIFFIYFSKIEDSLLGHELLFCKQHVIKSPFLLRKPMCIDETANGQFNINT